MIEITKIHYIAMLFHFKHIKKYLNENDYAFDDDWLEEDTSPFKIRLNMNDVFAWACADSEEVELKDFVEIYKAVIEKPKFGDVLWVTKRRGYAPQKPYREMMEKELGKIDWPEMDGEGKKV